jgi:hypothetical protein
MGHAVTLKQPRVGDIRRFPLITIEKAWNATFGSQLDLRVTSGFRRFA